MPEQALIRVVVMLSPGPRTVREAVLTLPAGATVQQALQASGGSRREAADLLGVSLRTLFYKLRRYRLE